MLLLPQVVVNRVSVRRREAGVMAVEHRGPLSRAAVTGLGSGHAFVRALRVRNDDVRVMKEGTRAQVVIVDALGVSLQVSLHVLWVEGEDGARHGRQGRGRRVGQVRAWGHGERW